MDDSLHARGKALEDQFFREKDRQLLDKLRAELTAKESRDALAAASGITDNEILETMLKNNISAESLTSVSLIPLVAVAWADGALDKDERAAILKAAEAAGITADSASYELVAHWLGKKPPAELLASWKRYIGALKSNLDAAAFEQIRTSVIDRANAVAAATGGFLGVGKTSAAESKILKELDAAFNKPS